MSKDRGPKIRFENLDGSSDDDDEYVDPLEAQPGEPGLHDDDDADRVEPRAGDPFKEEPDEDAKAALKPAADPVEDKAEDKRDAAEDKVDAPDHAAEVAALRRQLAEIEHERAQERKVQREARTKHLDDALARTRTELKTAIEEGDSDRQIELQDALAGLRAEKLFLDKAPEHTPAAPEVPQIQAKSQAAAKWLEGKAWVNNPAYAAQNKALLRIAQAVADDGYDPEADGYYQELQRRLAHSYPDLFQAKGNGVSRKPGQQTVGRVSRDDPPKTAADKGKRVLTADMQKNMVRFGLDPKNPEHAREYLRSIG
jgi:hypothetical protein